MRSGAALARGRQLSPTSLEYLESRAEVAMPPRSSAATDAVHGPYLTRPDLT